MRKANIAYIDDTSPYSRNLYSKIIAQNKFHLAYYAPKGVIGKIGSGKTSSDCDLPNLECFWTSHFYPLQIARRIAKDKPDLVHIQFELNTFGTHYTSLFIIPLMALLRALQRKVLVTIHTVIPRYCFTSEFANSLVPSTFTMLHLPALFYEISLSTIYTFVGYFSTAIIVHTNTQKKHLVSDYHLNYNDIFVIPQGVDYRPPTINSAKVKFWKKKLDGKKIILHFGSITPIKGLELLIRSFSSVVKHYSKSRLVIIGGLNPHYKSYYDHLRQLIGTLGLEKVVFFTGWLDLDSEDLNALFFLADVVAYSHIFPQSPSGSLEIAKKHGKKIVASSFEILKEQLSGYTKLVFVKPNDEKALSKAMLSAISTQEKESISSYGPMHTDSWDCVALKTLFLYRRLIAREK
jgi:glycosyltransferase involved in cell wall biosynthesis